MRRWFAAMFAVLVLLSSSTLANGAFQRRDYPSTLSGKNAVIMYTTQGSGAVSDAYAKQVLDLTEHVYEQFVTNLKFLPPRVLPFPVVLQEDRPQLGGAVASSDLGYDLYMQINPRMADSFALEDVVAHEFFHVLQASYKRRDAGAKWVVEGTASVAPLYAFPDRLATEEALFRKSLEGPLSMYWYTGNVPFKDQDYPAALFWYIVAERYGGADFLRRMLEWSAATDWEQAVQLAALQGGAPADTTFDSLWRSVVFDMVDGRLPKGYAIRSWFKTRPLEWKGTAADLTRGDPVTVVDPLQRGRTFYRPLALGPYTFELLEVRHSTVAGWFDLTVSGDAQGSVEAYVIKAGPALQDVVRNGLTRGPGSQSVAPPADPATRGAPLSNGRPVRLHAEPGDRTLVLVARTGNWGSGDYKLLLRPAGKETAEPAWLPLREIPHAPFSPGSPPPLSEFRYKELMDGSWVPASPDLDLEAVSTAYRVVELTPGAETAWDGSKEVPLPVPMTQDASGQFWYPIGPILEMLGGTVQGNTYTLGDEWITLTPGSAEARFNKGILRLRQAPRLQDGQLMVGMDVLSGLGCGISGIAKVHTLTYPNPHGPTPGR